MEWCIQVIRRRVYHRLQEHQRLVEAARHIYRATLLHLIQHPRLEQCSRYEIRIVVIFWKERLECRCSL